MQPSTSMDVEKILTENGFCTSIVQLFHENMIDKEELMELNTDDLKELGITALGVRKKLFRLIDSLRSSEQPCPATQQPRPATQQPHPATTSSPPLDDFSDFPFDDDALETLPLREMQNHPPRAETVCTA